jgi:hypothetical protein
MERDLLVSAPELAAEEDGAEPVSGLVISDERRSGEETGGCSGWPRLLLLP